MKYNRMSISSEPVNGVVPLPVDFRRFPFVSSQRHSAIDHEQLDEFSGSFS